MSQNDIEMFKKAINQAGPQVDIPYDQLENDIKNISAEALRNLNKFVSNSDAAAKFMEEINFKMYHTQLKEIASEEVVSKLNQIKIKFLSTNDKKTFCESIRSLQEDNKSNFNRVESLLTKLIVALNLTDVLSHFSFFKPHIFTYKVNALVDELAKNDEVPSNKV